MTTDHWNTDQSILRRAHDELTSVIDALSDDERQLPSPCPPWSVDDVIHHVVGGATMTIALLGGATGTTASDVRETWVGGGLTAPRLRTALALERAAFEVAAPDEQVDHPVVPMSAAELIGHRIVEYAVHTWDIRQASNSPIALDATLAHRAWQLAAPLAAIAAGLGVFGDGPSGNVAPDATDEARLVDVTGRRAATPHPDRTEMVTR